MNTNKLNPVIKRALCGGVALSALLMAGAAHAQDAAEATEAENTSDIIVTGSLIRGAAPTGGQLTAVTSEDIAALGVANTSQLLGSIPQDANFNNRPRVGSFSQFQTVNTPILRYLGGGASPSMSTLLLLDGRRLPGVGALQTAPDIDAIAPGALDRVDIVPDGGSATYGADAVGGVVNLISRKRFDGIDVGGHIGFADAYKAWDVTATAGKTWGNGSIWISYNHAENDRIYNRDRDFVRDLDYSGPVPVGNSLTCNPGNYVAGGLVIGPQYPGGFAFLPVTNYPIANGVVTNGPANTCDTSGPMTFLPSVNRHSVMAGLDVDLSDSINVSVKAYYMHRVAGGDGGPFLYSGISATAAGFPAGKVSGSLAPSFGDHSYTTTTTETWGVSPQITAKLGGDWQATAFFNYGEGRGTYNGAALDSTALAAFAANGSFNPFTGTFAATPAGQAARDTIASYRSFSSGKDVITNARAVIDGPLFALPGGDLRVAFGGEILREEFTQRNGNALASNLASIAPNRASRVVKSAFGELSVPILPSLTLSLAGRYDHYSDFGGTFNPKLGANFKPTSWWTLRGNWSKSYQAPSLAADANAIPVTLNVTAANQFAVNPAYPNTTGKFSLLLFPGGGVGLKPQKATTWELGMDFKPDFLPGLTASVTYYNIDFKDRIGTPSFFNPSFYTLYPNSFIMNTPQNPLTSADIAAFVAPATAGSKTATNVQQYIDDPSLVYSLQNALSQNLSRVKTSGVDFNVGYTHPTDFGSLFASVGGTYVLDFQSQATPTSPFQGFDANQATHLRLSTVVGAKVGGLLARATWNHTGGSAVVPTPQNANQTRISAFNVINLAFAYDFESEGALQDVTLSLNVDNLFDTDPPALRGANAGSPGFSGYTIGRFVQLGVKKKF